MVPYVCMHLTGMNQADTWKTSQYLSKLGQNLSFAFFTNNIFRNLFRIATLKFFLPGNWIGAGVGAEVGLGDVVVLVVVLDFVDGVVVLSVVIGTLSVVMGTLSLPFLVTSMGFRGPTLSVSVLFEFTAELTEFGSWLVAGVAILGIFWLFLGLNHPGNFGGPLGPFLLSLLALRQA